MKKIIRKLRILIPQTLGGPHDNIYNAFIMRRRGFVNQYPQLVELVKKVKPRRILEIGVFVGKSGELMIREAQKYNGEIEYYGIDTFDDKFVGEPNPWFEKVPMKIAAKRLMRTGAKIKLYKGNSVELLPKLIHSLPKMDFIYIDGGHSYETCKSDWENSRKLMHDETVVVIHDYSSEFPGVVRVVDEIRGDPDYEVQIEGDRAIVRRRK